MIFSKLMGQFVDVIQWTDDSPDTMVWRFERQGNEIKYGAKLTVREGQMAVFVNEGEIADTFTPGMYELFTRNLPILSHAAGLAARLREPVQGRGLFLQHARIFTDLKWGTKNPVIARDAEFGPVRLRAFGTYAIRIKDPSVFLREVVGTDGHFTVDEISDQLATSSSPGSARSSRARASRCSTSPPTTTSSGQFVLGRIAPEFANYGLELATILVENVSMPPEVEQAMDRRTSMGVVGDLSKYAQFQAAEAMRDGRRQPRRGRPGDRHDGRHGRGPAGEPMGPARPAEPPPAPPPVPSAAGPTTSRSAASRPGRSRVEQLREQAAKGGLTRTSLVWAAGMTGWQPAGEVPELAPLFAAVPPPIPAPPEPMPSGPWGGLRTERGRARPGRGASVSSPQLRQFPASSAARSSAMRRARPSWSAPIAATATRSPRRPVEIVEQPLGPALARCGGRAAAERARIPAKCAACGADFSFRAAELRRAVPVLRPARGRRPGALAQDPPDRACCRS